MLTRLEGTHTHTPFWCRGSRLGWWRSLCPRNTGRPGSSQTHTQCLDFLHIHDCVCTEYLQMHYSLLPTTKLGQGYVFTHIFDSVHRGVSGPGTHPPSTQPPWKQTPPREQTTLGADPPDQAPPQSRHPWEQTRPWEQTHPSQRSACWEIRAISRQYASNWNAILFSEYFTINQVKVALGFWTWWAQSRRGVSVIFYPFNCTCRATQTRKKLDQTGIKI